MLELLAIIILLIPCYSTFRVPNVGTSIYTEWDRLKNCWDADSLTLLRARMLLELLLPCPRSLRDMDNDFAADLIIYFDIILTTMGSLPDSRRKALNIYAMEDIIGGYFHTFVMPAARQSYYAGIMYWKGLRRLNRFYNNIKDRLGTEGQGWAAPHEIKWENTEARKLPMHPKGGCQTCGLFCNNFCIYNRKLAMVPSCQRGSQSCGKNVKAVIPVPFFDCKMQPHAVAVPFRGSMLYDVNSVRSAYVLIKYHLQSTRCLSCKYKHGDALKVYQDNLYTWLMDEVVPRFNDDKTYVAFGGVIRLIRTLEEDGAKHISLLETRQCYNRMAGVSEDPFVEYRRHKLLIILVALLFVLLLWFALAAGIIVCRVVRKRCKCKRPQSSKSESTKTKSSKSKSTKSQPKDTESSKLSKPVSSKTPVSATDISSKEKMTPDARTTFTSAATTAKSEGSVSVPPSSPDSTSPSPQPMPKPQPSGAATQAFPAIGQSVLYSRESSSSESRGLPPIEEISERSSTMASKSRKSYRRSVSEVSLSADSISDSDNMECSSDRQESPPSVSGRVYHGPQEAGSSRSGNSDNFQEDLQAQCYSDDSDATEETRKTDMSTDSIERFRKH